jgi:hypothetical protein
MIRILLLIKVIRICDHLHTDPPQLHFEPLQLLSFFDLGMSLFPVCIKQAIAVMCSISVNNFMQALKVIYVTILILY